MNLKLRDMLFSPLDMSGVGGAFVGFLETNLT